MLKLTTKTDEVYQALKNEIIEMRYAADELINEQHVAELYRVSKTPAREALNRLVQEGLLTKHPRIGYCISEIDDEEYYKLLYLRYTLEQGVIYHIIKQSKDTDIESLYEYCQDRRVAFNELERINRRFHLAMVAITKNEHLIGALRGTFEKLIRMPNQINYEQFAAEPHKGHRRLVAAMLARDYDEAHRLLREECRRADDIDVWF